MTLPSSPRLPSPWTLSAFWFGTAFMWLLLLLILMPAEVVRFVGDADKGKYLGLLGGIGAIVALVLPPIVGNYSDRIGKRLPLIRLGLVVNLVGLGVMGYAAAAMDGLPGFWVYVTGFLLVQFGNNYATAPYSALVPELVPTAQRGRYSGVMGMLQAGGQLLGGVGGAGHRAAQAAGLAELRPDRGRAAGQRPDHPARRAGNPDQTQPRSACPAAQHRPAVCPPAVFVGVRHAGAVRTGSVQRAAVFCSSMRATCCGKKDPGTATSILLMAIIAASIVTALIGGRVSDRIGRKPVIYLAGTVMAVMAVALLFAPNFYVAVGIALVFGLGFGAFSSVGLGAGQRTAMPSSSSYARDMGIWHVAFVGPQLIETPQGALLDWGNAQGGNLGYSLVFGIAAVCFVLGVLLVRNVPETVKAARTNVVT